MHPRERVVCLGHWRDEEVDQRWHHDGGKVEGYEGWLGNGDAAGAGSAGGVEEHGAERQHQSEERSCRQNLGLRGVRSSGIAMDHCWPG